MPSRRRRSRPATAFRTATAVAFRAVAVAALVGVCASPGWAAASAQASMELPLHARIVSSTPVDGSSVETASAVTLEFSEVVNPDFVAVTVDGPGGDETSGKPAAQGRTVTQALVAALAAGEHVVTFRVVSADGHPVSGTVRFETTQTAQVSPSPSPSAGPSSGALSAPPASETPAAGGGAAASDPATQGSATPSWLLVALGVVVLAALGGTVLWASRRGDDEASEDALSPGP